MFGADPDGKKTSANPDEEWWGRKHVVKKQRYGGRDPVSYLAWLFYTHKNQKMHSVMNVTDPTSKYVPILRSNFSRLMREGYTVTDLVDLIDKFWATSSAQRAGFPVLTFANRRFQRKLLSGTYAQTESAALRWVINNFNRTEELPWDEGRDSGIKDAILFDGMDVLYSYPELVADIIALDDETFSEALVELSIQLQWNWGEVDQQSFRLLELVPTAPPELFKRGRARVKQASINDAVAASQGA